MRKAPVFLAAMTSLAVLLCLVLNTTQVSACSECFCISDNSCTSGECSVSLTTNCTRREFTAACSGDYTLYTETSCTGGENCFKCQSCANLFKLSSGIEVWIANGHTNTCDHGVCTSSTTIHLNEGDTYVLYVCKIPCPDGSSVCGDNCTASSTAYACLSYGVLTCTP